MKLQAFKILLLLMIMGFTSYSPISRADNPCKLGEPGKVLDEAKCAGRTAESLKGADEDYYQDMDNGVTKHPDSLDVILNKPAH